MHHDDTDVFDHRRTLTKPRGTASAFQIAGISRILAPWIIDQYRRPRPARPETSSCARSSRLDSLTVSEKQVNDYVSEIDRNAEQAIIDTDPPGLSWPFHSRRGKAAPMERTTSGGSSTPGRHHELPFTASRSLRSRFPDAPRATGKRRGVRPAA